jgi:pyruvate kinase
MMMELRGREIRLSDVQENEGAALKSGQKLYVGCDNPLLPSNNKQINCNWKDLPKHVRHNDVLYIDDGKIILLVTDSDEVNFLALF